MHDEFATQQSSSYSKDEYYIAATDSKGHGTKSYMNVPPLVKGEIAALIASRTIPVYRTEMDFWRDAGVHRLHDLSEMLSESAPVMSGRLNILARQLAVMSDLEYQRRIIENDDTMYKDATVLLSHPPAMATTDAVRRAIAEINDPDLKLKLTRELEVYEARYLKD